jgi:hypothetical protein
MGIRTKMNSMFKRNSSNLLVSLIAKTATLKIKKQDCFYGDGHMIEEYLFLFPSITTHSAQHRLEGC